MLDIPLKFTDGSMIAINSITVENEVADNIYRRLELDYLIYNDPIGYADLILNGDPETYLRTVTEYKPLDSESTLRPWEKSCGHFFCIFLVNAIDIYIGCRYNDYNGSRYN